MNIKKRLRLLLPFFVAALTLSSAFSATRCFLVEENHHLLKQEGDALAYTTRYFPCSTFKIAISLMGYEEGILVDETHPEVAYEESYGPCFLEIWKEPHNPKTWIRDSCIWYSQWITKQLGIEKFKNYVTKFKYGNEDISGAPGKGNGLTHAWLCTSLKISPKEQMEFLEQLLASTLPVSKQSQEMTRKILDAGELVPGWHLYGKTGSGYQLKVDGSRDEDHQIGWFIGWLEKGDHHLIFVHYIEDDHFELTPAGPRARDEAKEKLKSLLELGKKN